MLLYVLKGTHITNIMTLLMWEDWLATGAQDGSIVVWDLETCQRSRNLFGHKVIFPTNIDHNILIG